MAVQKSRVTPSRRGQRRSHDALTAKQLATDPTSGETHLRHHVTADGFYRGKKVSIHYVFISDTKLDAFIQVIVECQKHKDYQESIQCLLNFL